MKCLLEEHNNVKGILKSFRIPNLGKWYDILFCRICHRLDRKWEEENEKSVYGPKKSLNCPFCDDSCIWLKSIQYLKILLNV